MNTRIAEIFAPKDMGTEGTEPIDLNVMDPISRLIVRFTAQNGSNDMDDVAAANLLKIELVDGSRVLYSLTGKAGQALNFYNRRKLPFTWIDNHNDHWNDALVSIDFGRFLYDPVLALLPANFRNLQLKITYDEDVCELEADNNFLSVYALLFDEKAITPIGFLSAKELMDYNLVAGVNEYIELPTDHILRSLFVNSRLAGYTPETNIGNVQLSEDADKRIPIDLLSSVLYRLIYEKYGMGQEYTYLDGIASNDHFFGVMCSAQFGVASGYGDHLDVSLYAQDGGDWYVICENTSVSNKGIIHGCLPHGSMPILFHDDQKIEDWYDVTKLGSLQLTVKAGASMGSGATAQIVTEQLIKY